MTLFLTLLPVYLFGNIHCLGMCGPMVIMIARHRFRYYYFLGRILSFTLTGWMAAEAGEVLNLFLSRYHIPAAASFIFGWVILMTGIFTLAKKEYPGAKWFKGTANLNRRLAVLILQDRAWASFLFGFFTLALPCGQTILVFSACALSASPFSGIVNGFAFAVLTSPSLLFAMHAQSFLNKIKHNHNMVLGVSGILIGMLALCRGFADLGIIPHLVLNPQSSSHYHLVIF